LKDSTKKSTITEEEKWEMDDKLQALKDSLAV